VFSDKILMTNTHNKETEKYFKRIISSSERMQLLINDLLSFSRHTTIPSDFKETDLNLLVKEVITELELEIESTHAQIHVTSLPVVHVIPSLMRQLFYNRKKTVSPVIHISVEPTNGTDKNLPGRNSARHFYTISVSDNGIGFDQKYADDIFVVFKRLHSYHEFKGSGVGLSICKKIMEKHSGFIRASGKPGEGSTFTIGLPDKQINDSQATSSEIDLVAKKNA